MASKNPTIIEDADRKSVICKAPTQRGQMAALMLVATVGFGLLQGARFLDQNSGPYSQSPFATLGLLVDGCTFAIVATLSYFAKIKDARTMYIVGAVMAGFYASSQLFIGTSSVFLLLIQIAAGIGWSANVLCWMHVFTSYQPRYALLMIAIGYAIDVALTLAIPASFDPHACSMVAYAISIVSLGICLRRNTFVFKAMKEESSPTTTIGEAFSRARRAIAATFTISIVCGFVIEYDTLTWGTRYAQTSLTASLCLVTAIGMVAYLLMFRIKKANIDYVSPLSVLGIASALLMHSYFGAGIDGLSGSIMTSILNTFLVFLWLMLISEAHERVLPAFFLLGLALGTARLSILLGRLCGQMAYQSEITPTLVYLAAAWVLIVEVSLAFMFYIRYTTKLNKNVWTTAERTGRESIVKENPMLSLPELAIDSLARKGNLSKRETEVIRDFAAGRSTRYIADWSMTSEHTVKTHVRRAYNKLDVHSRQELLDLIEQEKGAILKETALDN